MNITDGILFGVGKAIGEFVLGVGTLLAIGIVAFLVMYTQEIRKRNSKRKPK